MILSSFWLKRRERQGIAQTPAHEQHNPDLLRLIPPLAQRVVEVGCGSGALAREYRLLNPACDYLGLDVSEEYALLAQRYCTATLALDIEMAPDAFFARQRNRDCWVFGDCLEHLKDPWRVLDSVRRVIPESGCVAACVPNSQHWSLQARLALGEWRYEDAGLLDRTHLRFFTRKTIVELFQSAGFRIEQIGGRVFDEPGRDAALKSIGDLAGLFNGDREEAKADATPLQFIIRAVPA